MTETIPTMTETIPTKDAWGRTTADGYKVHYVSRDERGWTWSGAAGRAVRAGRSDTIEVQAPTVTVTLPLDAARDFLSTYGPATNLRPWSAMSRVWAAISEALAKRDGTDD